MSQPDRFTAKREAFNNRFKANPSDSTLILMDTATDEAIRFQHNFIGTEHLLLGAVLSPGTDAMFAHYGVEPKKVRSAVEFIIGRGDRTVTGDIGLTPRAVRVMEFSVDEARRLSDPMVDPEHVVLGMAREGEGIGAGVIESFGLSLTRLRSHVLQDKLGRGGKIEVTHTFPLADALTDLADLRTLLLNPEISDGHKANIAAVMNTLNRTYNPKFRS